MRQRRIFMAIILTLLSFAVTLPITAQTSGKVQGVTADGSAVPTNPVAIGGSDGTNNRYLRVDSSGRLLIGGGAADGAAVTGNPVLIAGQDGTNAQSIFVDSTGRQIVVGAAASGAALAGNPVLGAGSDGTNAVSFSVSSLGVPHRGLEFLRETVTRITPTASNGGTAVTIVSATASQVIYPLTLLFYNSHASTTHTVTLQDSTGPTELLKFQLAPGAGFIFDGRGDVRTDSGDGLQFKLAAAGTDVTVSGAAIKQ